MFSGIVEAQSQVLGAQAELGLVRIDVEKPADFSDIKTGDSIATNGVCLTVESFTDLTMRFALGDETLRVTGWSADDLPGRHVNLERSLRMGDRVHGHMVSGHVDATGEVVGTQDLGGSLQVDVRVPAAMAAYLWPKGSWALNGVSLTINAVHADGESVTASVCLIPETLKRTNLGNLEVGARVNVEIDMMARGMIHFFENSPLSRRRESP